MREIKFRVFDVNNKKMYPTDYELVKEIHFGMYGEIDSVIIARYRPDGDWEFEELKDVELMQYIGLKDKKGREIYEGDIVLVTYKNGECEKFRIGFINGAFVAIDIKNNVSHFNFDDYRIEEMIESIEVVGNIYENLNLLEEY